MRDLVFADDAALVAHSAESLQRLLERFSQSCRSFGLKVSLKKKVTMHQGSADSNSKINVDVNSLNSVDKFCYLGSPLTKNLDLNDKISKRIGKAAMNFGLLRKRAWKNNKLSTKVKIRMYEICMLSSLLYCAETQTTYTRHGKGLNSFHLRCLRKILKVRWQEKISDTEILKRSGLTDMETVIMQKRLRSLGHIKRMDDSLIPKAVSYSNTRDDSRRLGRPLLRYSNNSKRDMKLFDMNEENWEGCVLQRSLWREKVTTGTKKYEQAIFTKKRDAKDEEKAVPI